MSGFQYETSSPKNYHHQLKMAIFIWNFSEVFGALVMFWMNQALFETSCGPETMWNMRGFRCFMQYGNGKSCRSRCSTFLRDFIQRSLGFTLSFGVWLNPVCIGELTDNSSLWTPRGQNTHNSRYCIPASHALSLIVDELISVTFLLNLCHIHWPFVELLPFSQSWF